MHFEEDGAAVFVAALSPSVRDHGDDVQASPVIGELVEVPCGGDGAGAVVAYFYPQGVLRLVDGDLEGAAVS